MKKRIIITALMIMTLLVTGCGKVSFELTRIGDNTTIKATAADGKTADTEYFTVGKDEQVTIDASLEKGSLSLEFISVDVFIQSDNSPDDIIETGTVKTLKISGNDKATLDFDKGNYIIRITAVGDTEGTVKVTVGK
ncbi:MAG: hypothetical protein IKE77_09505 [Erysipelotrichaceae bacterium]|nr:hypothetical protein [Erysipelotrichaceae bacterium]